MKILRALFLEALFWTKFKTWKTQEHHILFVNVPMKFDFVCSVYWCHCCEQDQQRLRNHILAKIVSVLVNC